MLLYILYIVEKADAQYEAELARKAQTDDEIQAPVAETESTTVDKVIPLQQPAESDSVANEDNNQSTNVVTSHESVVTVPVSPSATNVPVETTSDPKSEEVSKNSAECTEGTACSVTVVKLLINFK